MIEAAVAIESPGDRLRRALDEQGYSIKRFARLLAESETRMTRDSWRRLLHKYLRDEHVPSRASAEHMARLLGCDASELRPARRVRRALGSRLEALEQENTCLRDLVADLEERVRRLERPVLLEQA